MYTYTHASISLHMYVCVYTSMARIWSMGIKSGDLSVKGAINLWEALVRSILEYGSEVWGKEKWLDGEQVQVDMAKRILRCSTMTQRRGFRVVDFTKSS